MSALESAAHQTTMTFTTTRIIAVTITKTLSLPETLTLAPLITPSSQVESMEEDVEATSSTLSDAYYSVDDEVTSTLDAVPSRTVSGCPSPTHHNEDHDHEDTTPTPTPTPTRGSVPTPAPTSGAVRVLPLQPWLSNRIFMVLGVIFWCSVGFVGDGVENIWNMVEY